MCCGRLFGKTEKVENRLGIWHADYCYNQDPKEYIERARVLALDYHQVEGHPQQKDFDEPGIDWLLEKAKIECFGRQDEGYQYRIVIPLMGCFVQLDMNVDSGIFIRMRKQIETVEITEGSDVSREERLGYICYIDNVPLGTFLNQFRSVPNVNKFLDFYFSHYSAKRNIPVPDWRDGLLPIFRLSNYDLIR